MRRLLRSPGFATIAILTLTLGIGATTAIFTLVYDALLKPLPYPKPGRLVVGVRMALGAQRANICAQVLREGLMPVIAGAIVGIAAAFGFARLLESLLFHTSPFNPAIAISAVALLMVAGAAACLLPARRAASVDPMQALRAE